MEFIYLSRVLCPNSVDQVKHLYLSCYQKATCPEVLYDEVIEVRERVVLVQEKSEIELPDESFLVTASTGEKVCRWIDTLEKDFFIHLLI